MPYFDGSGRSGTQYKQSTGAGTEGDPFIEGVSLETGANVIGNVGLEAGNNNVGDVDAKLIDENGTPYGVKQFSNSPLVINYPKSWAIAEGIYTNHYAVNKFGHNSAVGATIEPVWDYSGQYEYLADDTFATMYISSDSAADQGLTYEVDGLDSDYAYFRATVTTNGADGRTFVAIDSGSTDGKAWRIVRARNTGNAGAAAGNIYISKDNTDTGPNGIPDTVADIQAQILIGMEQTLMAMWTVPASRAGSAITMAYLTSFYAGTSTAKVTEIYLFYRPFGGVFNIKHILPINAGSHRHPYDFAVPYAPKGDLVIRAAAAGGGGEVSAGFDLWYE